MQGRIGTQPSKLHKKEENTDRSLYQIYLSKLNENMLKYNRYILFKENLNWLLLQVPDDFGMSRKTFRLFLYLN